MSDEMIFIDGLILKKPSEKAPKWVLWNISIKTEEFMQFIKDHDNGTGWLNIDVKMSKGNKVYCSLNNYKKGDVPKSAKKVEKEEPEGPEIEGEDGEIPF